MASPAALDIKELYTVKITDLPCQADFPFEQAFVGPCLQAYASFLPHRSFYCYRDDLRDDTDERTTWGVLCFSSRKDAISHAGFLIANPIQLSDDPVRSVLFYATQRSVSVLERVHADPDVAAKALEEVLRQDADKERWEGAGRGNPPALGQSGPKLTPQKRGAEEGLQRPPSGGQRPDPAWRAEPGPSAAPADRQQQGAVPVREPPLQKGAQWLGRTVPQAPPPTQPPANAALDAFTRAREGSRRMIAETLRTSEFLDAEDEAQVQAETTALAASIEGELLRLLGRNEVEYIKKASWLARNLRRNKDLLWMVVSQQLKPPELVRMSEKQLEACRREEPADENEGANRRTEEEIAGQFASNGGPSGHLWEPMDEMEPPPPPPPPPPRQSNSAVTAEMDDRVAAALINEEDAAVSKLRGGVDIAEDMELESPPPKLSPPNVPPERVGEWEPMDAGVAWETRKSEAFKGAVDPRQEVLLKGSGVFWTGPLQWGTQSVEVTAAGLRPLKRSPSTFVLPPEIKIGKSMTLQNVDRVLEEVSTPSKDLPRFWLLGQGLPQASANAANVVGRVLINAKGELLPHYSAGWDRKVPYGWELFIMVRQRHLDGMPPGHYACPQTLRDPPYRTHNKFLIPSPKLHTIFLSCSLLHKRYASPWAFPTTRAPLRATPLPSWRSCCPSTGAIYTPEVERNRRRRAELPLLGR